MVAQSKPQPQVCPKCGGRLFQNRYFGGTVEYSCLPCGWSGETRMLGRAKETASNIIKFPSETVSTREAADILGLTREHVIRLCQRDRLDCELTPKGYRISRQSVASYQTWSDFNREGWLNSIDAAKKLGISKQQVSVICLEGKLKHVRVPKRNGGSAYLFRESDIEEYLQAREEARQKSLPEGVLNSAQAAEVIGCTLPTISKICLAGKIRYQKVIGPYGRKINAFRQEDVEAYKERRG